MSYSRVGRRPAEFASKASHHNVINDAAVQSFLDACHLPKPAEDVDLGEEIVHSFQEPPDWSIDHVIAVDGGYSEVPVRAEFPSATVSFFQFGALFFSMEDLDRLENEPFLDPEDMARLKNIERLKLTLPTKNVVYGDSGSLSTSVRRALYEFFCRDVDGEALIKTLRWFLFEEYRTDGGRSEWVLASSPFGDQSRITLRRQDLDEEFCWRTSEGPIYLTDVFRLHERVDDEVGAGGIQSYVTTTIEQLLVVHLIRLVLATKPSLLGRILFVKDGPLAFFGQTARMHEPMRALVTFLQAHHSLFLVGLEKSGAFVEHAHVIRDKLAPGSYILLSDEYIYRYIIPGKVDPNSPYGRTTYYGMKLLFKTKAGGIHVVTMPTTKPNSAPTPPDVANLPECLAGVQRLRCDMYDDALMPIALVNKLVSLADHPSTRILRAFAAGSVTS